MRIRLNRIIVVALLSVVVFPWGLAVSGEAPSDAYASNDYMVRYRIEDSFEFVRDLIVQAIAERGLKVNNVSHIGEMLARTGKDIGASKQVYIKAEAIEFCSATVSRRMMEADPHNIIFCPYIITIYVKPSEPDWVYVAYRRPQKLSDPDSLSAMKEVEKLIDGIVRDALGLS